MPYSWSQTNVDAAQAALDKHDDELGLEEGNGDEVQVYHLVASLLEFCDARGLDFDEILDEVRSEAPLIRNEQPAL
jgi:hypothetical protein